MDAAGGLAGPSVSAEDELAVRLHSHLQRLRATVDRPVVVVAQLAELFGCSETHLEQLLHALCASGRLEALRTRSGEYYVNRA